MTRDYLGTPNGANWVKTVVSLLGSLEGPETPCLALSSPGILESPQAYWKYTVMVT